MEAGEHDGGAPIGPVCELHEYSLDSLKEVMKMDRAMAFGLSLLCAACASSNPVPAVAPRPLALAPDSTEYVSFARPGSLELTGQAFLTTRGGDVKLAAGRMVTLDPSTSFSREWFRRFGADAGQFDIAPNERLFVSARRTTVADAQGKFRFVGLARGQYLVRTTVTWETGSAYGDPQGGVVAAIISVPDSTGNGVILNQVFTPSLASTLGIAVLRDNQLIVRQFRTLARVSGESCQVGLLEAGPTEGDARSRLILSAARRGADAVAHVACTKHGMSFSPNCTSRIRCEGDAIVWL